MNELEKLAECIKEYEDSQFEPFMTVNYKCLTCTHVFTCKFTDSDLKKGETIFLNQSCPKCEGDAFPTNEEKEDVEVIECIVEGFDTSGFNVGDKLYASEHIAGAITLKEGKEMHVATVKKTNEEK